jgi:poly-beta-1,6-N-acetyl-D-glucosamine synthase
VSDTTAAVRVVAGGKVRSAHYVTVRSKFIIAVGAACLWFAGSLWISQWWIADLSTHVGGVFAWAAILAIALVPGWLNAFLVFSLALDRPPALRVLDDGLPPVTILVAAYNEEARIAETLESIRALDYPAPVSVIVIDDGSTDCTREIVTAVAAEHGGVGLIQAEHGGKAAALVLGLAQTTTEYVVTIDADTWLHAQGLKRLMSRFVSDPCRTAAVAGCVLARNSRFNTITSMEEWDYFLAIASVKRQQALFQGTLVAQGAFSAYRTDAVREAGGWPSVIGEDIVLTWALIEQGYRIGLEPTAVAFTDVPVKVRTFARQRKRWARGMIEGLRTHGHVIAEQHRLVAFLMGLDLLFPVLDLAYTVVFLPSLILALFGYFWIAGPMTLAILPLTFGITMVMYRQQKRVFSDLGLHVRKNRAGYFLYLLVYQAIMSPVCVAGYAQELFGAEKAW